MRRCEAQSHTGTSSAVLSRCPYDAFETVAVSGERYEVCYFHGKVARGEIRDLGGTGRSKSPVVSWPAARPVAIRAEKAEQLLYPMTEPDADVLAAEWMT